MFNNFFGKKPTVKGIHIIKFYVKFELIQTYSFLVTEQQRENDRALRRAGRDIEKERRVIEQEEKKIVSKILFPLLNFRTWTT